MFFENLIDAGSEIDACGVNMEVWGSTLGPQGDAQKMREKIGPEGSLLVTVLSFWVRCRKPNLVKNHVFLEPWFLIANRDFSRIALTLNRFHGFWRVGVDFGGP